MDHQAAQERRQLSGGTTPAALEVEHLSRSFGGVFAVQDVTLRIAEGELRGVIGPNGAGKSTLFNLITGLLSPDTGSVSLRGQRIDAMAAHRRAHLGVAIVFQGARLFRSMTALENVMVGAHTWTRHGFWSAGLRLPRHGHEEARIRQAAEEALERVGLGSWAGRDADSLPLGQQRSLQVARALCARPSLLLLDEPAAGLRAGEREVFGELLGELHASGLTMMLVEHDVAFVSRLVDRVTVLDLGRLIAEGAPAEVTRDERVVSAYLGQEAAEGA